MVRRLTAIMFTDMVGYTSMVERDETRARVVRDLHHEILRRRTAERSGRILQIYGDGALSVFPSAVEAVRCAIDLQGSFIAEDIPVRIGIHTGDVVHDDDGVFGDGVNVAARIQSLAPSGGILISDKVHDETRNQTDITTIPLGAFSLKNVSRAMTLHAVTNTPVRAPEEELLSASRCGRCQSVAVLPFESMSADAEDGFFADGITEEVINALTRVNGLRVTARTSSFAFKGQPVDVREVGRRLDVTHVLEGSVRRAGRHVRVTAQLVTSADGYHVYSETFDRTVEDVLGVQDDIAGAIVSRMADHLTAPSSGEGVLLPPTPHSHDGAAHREYLKGRFHWNRWTPEGVRLSIDHFERSAAMDPRCALPWSGLAAARAFLGTTGHLPPAQAFPEAERAALRALELEGDVAESHLALALVRLFWSRDWHAAYASFQRAIALAPGSAEVRHLYALFLLAAGVIDEAVEEAGAAAELDPLSGAARYGLARALYYAERLEEAEREARMALERDPGMRGALEILGLVHLARGRATDAVSVLDQIPARAGEPTAGAGVRGLALTASGDPAKARRLTDLVRARQASDPSLRLHLELALVHAGLGEHDTALRQLKRAIDDHVGSVLLIQHAPHWRAAALSRDPRYAALLLPLTPPAAATT